jgi:hypothetical protein
MFDTGVKFPEEGFFKYADEHLPAYSRPAFLRVVENLEVTGTYKLKKTELQRQGFDLAQVKDPLYYRDEKGKTYAKLTPQVLASIQEQKLRI